MRACDPIADDMDDVRNLLLLLLANSVARCQVNGDILAVAQVRRDGQGYAWVYLPSEAVRTAESIDAAAANPELSFDANDAVALVERLAETADEGCKGA
jgi:hypothetical protein